ncbi:hypothetical protein GCM10008107_02400 [Psychrosphaera saromensis]|uniref:DUF4381 domain-containing protein n=1 Tax=Psychrosphaera saromensis TaxID=716813 RepID=A0A2S7UZU9_9GAMM|nr:DUF4381 domain-containing protein [Psychrosphaera saromensis]PQJ54800.1 hypothetical protein BTO11_14845 [Psychrosphaera saromensis]GHB57018.1 hypothetical protein GCM10008107_02400 [Psychrosphaera saromensis]GLQ13962.1 hypothetical protein GCM10007917_14170 [Psychrosphaera saromensis]
MQPDLLSQLKDIQTPQSIGNWPLAWGWWVIIVVCCVLIAIAIVATILFLQKRKAKKQALKLLNALDPEQNPIHTVQSINSILKRVVLAYGEREQVANLNGDKWATWLNNNSHDDVTIAPEFMLLAYQANCSSVEAAEYLKQSKAWIDKNLPLNERNKGEQNV